MIAFFARRNSPFLLAAFVLASGLACWSSGLHAKPWKPAAWKVPKEHYDVVSAINLVDKTVSIHHVGGTVTADHTLKINGFSEILVDEKKASLADLKSGMWVVFKLGGDGTTLAQLATVAAPAPPPTLVATATPSFPSGRGH